MPDLESMKSELESIDSEITSLEYKRDLLEEKIERWSEAEKIKPFVLAALNKNYNRWCDCAYLDKHIPWDETAFKDEDEDERLCHAVDACEMLLEKGIVQRKEVGRDIKGNPIFNFRITDTETIDMFENLEEKK